MVIPSEIFGFTAAILTTASFLPQTIKTMRTRDTGSLSLSMYSLFTLGVLCWLIYGLLIMDYAIIFANAITFVLASIILAFKILHTVQRARRAHS